MHPGFDPDQCLGVSVEGVTLGGLVQISSLGQSSLGRAGTSPNIESSFSSVIGLY